MQASILTCVCVAAAFVAGLAAAHPEAMTDKMVIVNPSKDTWQHDPGDPPGSQSIVLREDSLSSGIELLARYPAGHVFPPHWHSANERIVLLEGQLSIKNGNTVDYLESGGFAYLPARQLQRMACVSQAACSFYVYWDGKLDFHKESELPNR